MEATDRAILELAAADYRQGGSREQQMRDRFGMSAVQFWVRVVAIIARPDPVLAVEMGPEINRLRRLMDSRRHLRRSRRPTT